MAEVVAGGVGLSGGVLELLGGTGDAEGVEVGVVNDAQAGGGKALGKAAGVAVDAEGDIFQSFGSVEQGVHGGKDGEKDLGGTDVAGGTVAADVLFAGLEGEAVGGASGGVLGDTDEAAGQEALVGEFGGEVGRMGATESHGDAEALGVTDGDVGAEFAGRKEKEQGEGVGDQDGESAGVANLFQRGAGIMEAAVGLGIGEDAGKEFAGEVLREVGGLVNSPAEGGGTGVNDGGGGGMEAGGEPEGIAFRLVDRGVGEGGGLGGGSTFIEEGGIGDLEPSEVENHGLEVEKGFQTALGDFGLVGGVGAVPPRILDDVAAEHGGRDGAVVAESDEGAAGLVLGKDFFEFGQGGSFRAGGWKVGWRCGGEPCGQGGLDDVFEGFEAEEGEHLLLICFGGAEVTG